MTFQLSRSRLLTIPEVAERLRISKRSAYRIAREMMHVKIAGRLLVPEPAVDRYVEERLRDPVVPAGAGANTRTRSNRRAWTPSTSPRSSNANWFRPIVPRTRPKDSGSAQ